jgi:hypothetical protein
VKLGGEIKMGRKKNYENYQEEEEDDAAKGF